MTYAYAEDVPGVAVTNKDVENAVRDKRLIPVNVKRGDDVQVELDV
jgi:hypothetical protein